jgi:hypothetical protein
MRDGDVLNRKVFYSVLFYENILPKGDAYVSGLNFSCVIRLVSGLILNCTWQDENGLRHSSSNYYPHAFSTLNRLANHNSNCRPKGLLIRPLFILAGIHISMRDKS